VRSGRYQVRYQPRTDPGYSLEVDAVIALADGGDHGDEVLLSTRGNRAAARVPCIA
jgi:hypothetical protein